MKFNLSFLSCYLILSLKSCSSFLNGGIKLYPKKFHVHSSTQSFVEQKNLILLEKLQNPIANLTEVAEQYVNFCDESFDLFLNEKISMLPTEKEKQKIGKIRYEINCARQRKLREADMMLRGILMAGDFNQMQAKLAYHLHRSEIDMAFLVILQLNIEDAVAANSTKAVEIMTHLGQLINEHQDSLVSPPVRLMRLLVRTDDSNVRKQMLRQKLIVGDEVLRIPIGEASSKSAGPVPQATVSPQCEHIVVQAVQDWGGADVLVAEFEATISDVLEQVSLCTQLESICTNFLFHIVCTAGASWA